MIKQTVTVKGNITKSYTLENRKTTAYSLIKINEAETYQTLIGFGGAFTEACAHTFYQMDEADQNRILKAYFHPVEGLGYVIGRVHINSCDFALGNYTYVEPGDKELKTFDISREHKYVIPMIKAAEKVAGKKIRLLASPWSPPSWMKSNNDMNHGGKLLPEFYQTWADYYVKFIDAYQAAGLEIFAVTVQNEPAAVQTWDSCVYTAEEERDFVKNYLGPTLNKYHPEVKIIIWDHNRDEIVERADTVLKDKAARDYVWGTGIHWYVSEEFENVGKVHDLHPDKHLLFTEGCIEGGVQPGSLLTGERYARNMIGDFSNHCEGYLDWNLVLNEIGGPNHVGNYCDAPIICDTKQKNLTFNSSYHYIAHFSKFLKPGAKRIFSHSDNTDLKQVAFQNPDVEVVVVVLNESEREYNIKIKFAKTENFASIPARSISTFVKKEK